MVRAPCFDSYGIKKGAWSEEEDNKLRAFVLTYGHWNWRLLPKYAGLSRCGKSCRLRWVNYLKPGVKRGNFTKQEQDFIIKLHAQLGNKWSIIATYLPGRTDNDIKNFWNAHVEKRSKRNPYAKKVKWQTRELASDHVLKEENLSSTSLTKLQEPPLPFDATISLSDHQVDLWPHDHHNYLPPLIDEEFFYESSTSGFRYHDHDHDRVLVRDRDIMSCEHVAQPVQGNESFSNSNFQNEIISCYDVPPQVVQQEGGLYDPLFDLYFSYGMHFLS